MAPLFFAILPIQQASTQQTTLGVTTSRKYKVGEQDSYRVTYHYQLGRVKWQGSTIMSLRTRKVYPNGDALLDQTFTNTESEGSFHISPQNSSLHLNQFGVLKSHREEAFAFFSVLPEIRNLTWEGYATMNRVPATSIGTRIKARTLLSNSLENTVTLSVEGDIYVKNGSLSISESLLWNRETKRYQHATIHLMGKFGAQPVDGFVTLDRVDRNLRKS